MKSPTAPCWKKRDDTSGSRPWKTTILNPRSPIMCGTRLPSRQTASSMISIRSIWENTRKTRASNTGQGHPWISLRPFCAVRRCWRFPLPTRRFFATLTSTFSSICPAPFVSGQIIPLRKRRLFGCRATRHFRYPFFWAIGPVVGFHGERTRHVGPRRWSAVSLVPWHWRSEKRTSRRFARGSLRGSLGFAVWYAPCYSTKQRV